MAPDRVPSPGSTAACMRRGPRFRLLHAETSYVEFEWPAGRGWRLGLLEIGAAGICFGLEDGRPEVAVGDTLAPVRLQIEEVTIEGSIRIAHVTEEFSSGTVCGAEFRPSSEADAEALAATVASLAG